MIKFKANDQWYKLAAFGEEELAFSSGGRLFFNSAKSKEIAPKENPRKVNDHQKNNEGRGLFNFFKNASIER